jgi:hypothetical protein
MPPAVFRPGTQNSESYRKRLFVKQAEPTVLSAERAVIRTLHWKPPAKIRLTACMLCCVRSIDRITVVKGDAHLLSLLGLQQLGDAKNRRLAQLLREMP